jgi:hypothetical protein
MVVGVNPACSLCIHTRCNYCEVECVKWRGEKGFARKSRPVDGKVKEKQNPRTNRHQDNTGTTQIGPSTDSGYASATHRKFEHDQNIRPQKDTGYIHNLPPTDEELDLVKNNPSEGVQISTAMGLDDARTVYSDAESLPDFEPDSYISELANDLLHKARSERPGPETIQRITAILPKLLKAFALKVGYNAPSQEHRDVMWFIHKNRE